MTDERATFRYVIGAIAIVGGFASLGGLYFIAIPDGNREPILLAIGLVLGWGSTVIGYEFGSSPSGRKAADAGIAASQELAISTARITEQAATASLAATETPKQVEVVNTVENPAIVSEAHVAADADERPDYAR